VRADLAKAHLLDPRYLFTFTWSSSGISGYGFSLLPKSGITGTFVAMSVFRPAMLPVLSADRGHHRAADLCRRSRLARQYLRRHPPGIGWLEQRAAKSGGRRAGSTARGEIRAPGFLRDFLRE